MPPSLLSNPSDRAQRTVPLGDAFFSDDRYLAPRRVERVDLGDGAFLLRSPEPLKPWARSIGVWLDQWAQQKPNALAVAEPTGLSAASVSSGWTSLTWVELRSRVGSVAQALLDMRLAPGAPVVILSDNSLDHLVLMLAAMHVGRVACTVSSAYCRLAGGDFSRIRGILDTLAPGLVYASDVKTYGPAIRASGVKAPVVYTQGVDDHPGAVAFNMLATVRETDDVQRAFAGVGPDTHAKYLLTSGSTGHPKVVINTHGMLCANQQMVGQALRFLALEPPVLLDWLPWSHTFGGNHNINSVLRNGGTLYIDDGRPVPGLIDRTVAHLREVQPTVFFNVPRGYDMLLPALEADSELARRFFERMHMVFYAGAGMPLATWKRLEAVAARVRSEPVWFTTSWGSTETSPANTAAHWWLDRPGVIGLPLPGADLKFVPNAGKLEMRVRGPHIFPGYRGNDRATREAFDEDGFYRIGDAGFLLDESDAASGVVFNGRVAEDFKLTTGTWVSVGTLRLTLVTALAPWAQDAVITGHDRTEVGALVFLSEGARAQPLDEVKAQLREKLAALAAQGGGSSQTPRRLLLLADAPSLAAGEITDKGYINQRMVLQRRAADVEALYAADSDPRAVHL
jgi:feruloyl-CoA synthase